MTFTYDDGYDRVGSLMGSIRKIIATWTSDGSGDAAGTTGKIVGELMKAVTVPSATAAPTTLYDITITDENSADVLGNCFDDLVDRSATVTETVDFFLNDGTTSNGARPSVCDALTVTVANAGVTKSGTLYLYYKVGLL